MKNQKNFKLKDRTICCNSYRRYTQDTSHDRYKIMQEACFELSRYADELEAHLPLKRGLKQHQF